LPIGIRKLSKQPSTHFAILARTLCAAYRLNVAAAGLLSHGSNRKGRPAFQTPRAGTRFTPPLVAESTNKSVNS
jgi:hypothetical protein